MTSTSLNLATAWEAVADVAGGRPALAVDGRRTSWMGFERRAAGVATTLTAHGLGAGSKVALFLYNGAEYPEAQFAAFKIRGVPANVNYRYVDDELAYILDNSDAEAIVFDADLADRVAAVRDRCPGLRVAVQVGGDDVPPWAVDYEVAAAADPMPPINRSGDDLWFLYTGGTTGMPKAVMWDHTNLLGMMENTFRPFGEAVPTTPAEAAATAERVLAVGQEIRQLCGAPLMHGTSGLPALATLTHGGMLATLSARSFDADELWEVVERERITMTTVVGDAFTKPMVEALDRAAAADAMPDLSSLRLVLSSGVIFSAPVKERLLAHHPCTIVDALGSSEGAGMARQVSTKGSERGTARFALGEHTTVFTDDDREVAPGSGERGRVALGYPLPLGYYKDPDKTAAVFPTVNGRRWSIPGDYATVEADGTITLLGRGSACINTGGEKVYPEEVEEALKELASVRDANVVGLADDRWGQAVTAVVELEPGVEAAGDVEAALRDGVRAHLAGYKVPKRIVVVPRVERSPNGKTDYAWARVTAETAVGGAG